MNSLVEGLTRIGRSRSGDLMSFGSDEHLTSSSAAGVAWFRASASASPSALFLSRVCLYALCLSAAGSAIMKRLLSKTFKTAPFAAKPAPAVAAIPATTNPPLHHTGLQPKDTLPPVPHPCPYEHISIVATPEGLLLRPRHPGQSQENLESEVKVEWGKGGKVETIAANTVEAEWEESVVVYGIIGFLELYSGNYILPPQPEHRVKNVRQPRTSSLFPLGMWWEIVSAYLNSQIGFVIIHVRM